MELGSVDQANDLVKLYSNCPPAVNGEPMDFSISTTFSFLQVDLHPTKVSCFIVEIYPGGNQRATLYSREVWVQTKSCHFCVSSEFSSGEFHSSSDGRERPIRSYQHRETLRLTALHTVPAIDGELHHSDLLLFSLFTDRFTVGRCTVRKLFHRRR